MADVPSGQWSHLLVGHQWPDSGALAILGAAAASRAVLGADYEEYADVLQSIRTGVLDSELGVTAESAHQSFRSGESSARDVAARNLAKHQSYASARQWIAELRTDLESIAESGNSEIRRILESNDPAPHKINAIVQTVTEAQAHANTMAASCSANLCDAIQTILTAGDDPISARELARSNGIDLQHAFGSPNSAFIHNQVSAIVAEPSATSLPAIGGAAAGASPVSVPDSLVPDSLVGNMADGAAMGAPLARGGEALAAAAVGALHTESSAAAPANPVVPPSQVAASAQDPGHGAGAPAAVPTPVTAAAFATPVTAFATPVTASATPVTASATPAGPLPGYGAELRPTKSAAPLIPPLIPAAAAPAGTGAAATALAHATTVRPTPVPAVAIANALGAFASGAVASTEAARTAAENRLRRLLHAVVRQEPGLRWAIGEYGDGSTVLVTDLASGWVPPHITIPAGVALPGPASRPGSTLAALLGDAVQTAIYDPNRRSAPDDEGEPVAMSITARRTPAVDDLAWELARATRWRDGLPRLAHTLARAAWARTGCLESEIALLRDHLGTLARTVVDSYPDAVNAADVANWQLLATVEALVDESPTLADYHFAWFHARAAMDTAPDVR
ncbi:MAG: DUF5631 domain-containing protein [Mycobacterium sp.]